ncbi:MAG TPA: ABC transporter ATP-binding protein [Acidimicrobiales bacterium]|jgi:iron(III) transport system ATP-binding protein|nr:ABC transporter ATP-binding protein [Acidimicrobiales bacterium]
MSRVTINGLRKQFDGKPPSVAIENLELDINEGEFVALLGPSGCGKTTTLRSVAGLERPDEGEITIGGTTVFAADKRVNQPPDRRHIGMVFQSYALWPHMTVRKNIGYPLRARRQRAALKSGRVEETARLVECDDLLDRYPAQLSGGQQQRVALARALAAQPQVILFDEPLSNLDARLRDQMRAEIHRLHRDRPFTAIYVTHDQSEALALGQRIAIMRAGHLEQLGTPAEVFEHPATEYVAGFIGLSNRLVFERNDGKWWAGGAPVFGAVDQLTWNAPTAVRFGMDDTRLLASEEQLEPNEVGVTALVVDTEFGGRHRNFSLEAGACHARTRMLRGGEESWTRSITRGDSVVLAIDPRRVAAYPDTGAGAADLSDGQGQPSASSEPAVV